MVKEEKKETGRKERTRGRRTEEEYFPLVSTVDPIISSEATGLLSQFLQIKNFKNLSLMKQRQAYRPVQSSNRFRLGQISPRDTTSVSGLMQCDQ
jgi:hypothetical protein